MLVKLRKRILYRGDVYLALESERLNVLPNVLNSQYMNGVHDGLKKAEQLIAELEDADAEPVVRCKDCKHKPTKPEKYNDGFDLAFPDEVCPCYCDGDPFYSWYPKDDWFCSRGERKGGTSDDNNI